MPARSLAVAMLRRHGSRIDDLILRAFATVALLGIVGSLVDPTVAALAPFVLFTMWTNGPHSALLVAAYEPVLLLYGQLFSPLLIAALGTIATLFVEWANYRLYGRARDTRVVRSLTGGRWVQRLTRMFARRPFLVVVLCALGVVPYTLARCLSVLSLYPVERHLAATAVGRFPRLLAIAALGAPLAVPRPFLMIAVLFSFAVAALLWFLGRRASLVPRSA
ncbi:MAG TPA: VTT domain-containing protein [Gemmatimonadales bacterium]|nr:VTT domain-containing protein [Gemmatimonadales bacterium]